MLGGYVLLNDPDLIRPVLVEKAANYPKDALQLEKLTPAVGRGLLTAEPDSWRLQRRTVAPLFQPASVAGYLAPMAASIDAMLARWEDHARSGAAVDIAREMTGAHLRHHLAHGVLPRDRDAGRGDGRGDHHLFRGARAHRLVGCAAAAALAAAAGLHPREARAGDFPRGGAPPCGAAPGTDRGGRHAAGRSGHAADAGARSGNRRAALRYGDPRQSGHLHRRRPRDDRERAGLDAVPALGVSRGRCGGRRRSRCARRGAGRGRSRASHRHAHDPGRIDAALSAGAVPEPRGGGARPDRRCGGDARHARHHRAVGAAPAPQAVGGARPVLPGALSRRRTAERSRALPICRSARARASASAWALRCRRCCSRL